jgi:prephenate dehydratase
VGDELNNETRYMILGKSNTKPLQSGDIKNKKSSIVIAVPNQPQALFKIVSNDRSKSNQIS